MTVEFRTEKIADVYFEIQTLLAAHYDEVAPYKDLLKLNPDDFAYKTLENAGKLVICTARDEGVLIGYMIFVVTPHPHYKDTVVANEDLKFIDPARRGTAGIRLIKYAEAVARDRGAKILFQRSKAKSEHRALYDRLGYDLVDEVYAKRLDGADHGS